MPFDGFDTSYGYVAKLDQVSELIAAPNQWIKHSYNTPWGGYCLKEVLNRVGVAEAFEPILLKAAEQVTGRAYCCIESFNDHPLTTRAEVLAVLDQARTNIVSGTVKLPAMVSAKIAIRPAQAKAGWVPMLWRKIFA
jgi:hypothetical protein